MKHLFKFMSILTAAAVISTACSSSDDDNGDPILSELQIEIVDGPVKVNVGESTPVSFTVSGINGANVTATATTTSSKWSVSATVNSSTGAGVLTVVAPSEVSTCMVTLKITDEAGNRTVEKKNIPFAASAENLDPFTLTFDAAPVGGYVVDAGQDLTIGFTVGNLAPATLTTPVASNVTVSPPLTVKEITYNPATFKGIITISCPESATQPDAILKLKLEDNMMRETEGTIDIIIEPMPTPELINCFIVAPGATQQIDPVYSSIVSAGLLWQDEMSLITSVTMSGGKINVATTAGKTGNAVVFGKNAGGTIVWSWHIWVTNYDPNAAGGSVTINSVTFMDRNLGARVATKGDFNAYGCNYEWGRKDPFYPFDVLVASGNALTKVVYDIDNAVVPASTNNAPITLGNPYPGTYAESIANPNIYYTRDGTTFSWWKSTELTELTTAKDSWGGVSNTKGLHDPCPAGWQVPRMIEGTSPFSFIADETNCLWDDTNKGYSYTPQGGTEIWIPAAGVRYRTSAQGGRVGSECYYWLNDYRGLDGNNRDVVNQMHAGLYQTVWYRDTYMNLDDLSGSSNFYSACAASIRCVKIP